MNIKQELIYINKNGQWIDKTAEIALIMPNNEFYNITFQGSTQSYLYRKQKVRWLSNPTKLDPQSVQLLPHGTEFFNYEKILHFKSENYAYYRIFFQDGTTEIYKADALHIIKKSPVEQKNKSCFSYLKQLSNVVGLKVDGVHILKKQYDQLNFIRKDSALARYLNPSHNMQTPAEQPSPIFPFGCNHSQIEAVYRAFSHQISVIEGPPGTGKTQTILNIIANVLFQGQTVAVVSNNNAATENVLEKLQKYGLDFLIAPLGKSDNKSSFLKTQTGFYPDISAFQLSKDTLATVKTRALEKAKQLREMLLKQNILSQKKEELSTLQLEKQHFDQFFSSATPAPHRKNLTAQTVASVRAKIQVLSEINHPFTIFHWLYTWLWKGIGNYMFLHQNPSVIYACLSKLYYTLRVEELIQEITVLQNALEAYSFTEKLNSLTEDSLAVLKATLYEKYGMKTNRQIFTDEDLWKQADTILDEYPIILSTTHSLRTSLKNVFYDYVIVDEASQVDLVTGALSLSCARNAVIVGDQKQLPNVVDATTAKKTDEIFKNTSLPEGYRYSTNSLLSSLCLLLPEIPKTLLQEHYRCHPKIIRFCNQRFYHGQLIAMTQDYEEDGILGVCKTVQGNHARGHYNQRQIDEIKQEILPDLLTLVRKEEIGIISPYRAQKDAMQNDETLNDFAIDTVHKFQGREKDAIVITTVDNEITPFTDNPNMLNVAVSRAKKYLRVLISDNEKNKTTNFGDLVRYIEYNGGTILQGKVRSVFDLLYKGYESELRKQLARLMDPLEFDSENLIFLLLQKILSRNEFSRFALTIHQPLHVLIKDFKLLNEEEQRYAKSAMAHTDFLLFNKMDKSPILVVEVDGYTTHTLNTAQIHRDMLKDQILTKYSIPFIRLRTNECNEEDRIIHKLNSITAKTTMSSI